MYVSHVLKEATRILTVKSWTFFFSPHTHGMWKVLGQGLNLCHSSNLGHSSDNTGSLTRWASRNSTTVEGGGRTCCIWRFPGQGSRRSCSRWPTPQPQQCGIWAVSATCNAAHGNAGSLTHWVRPGIKPETSWFLVGFVCAEPQRELPRLRVKD